jgi:dynein heavy chain
LLHIPKLQVEAELRRLGSVYGIYGEYADAVRQYSGQLWSELDVGRMVDGMQEVRCPLRS